MKEIERKYEVIKLPDITKYEYKKIEQGYLCHNPIVRIRKSNEDYYMTYKSKTGLPVKKKESAIVHNEIELPLTEEAYINLRTKVDGHMVYKTRYLIPIADGLTAELDIFEKSLEGLVFAEVEFKNEEDSYNFKIPDWFGKEISNDKRFSNYYLSTISGYEELGL